MRPRVFGSVLFISIFAFGAVLPARAQDVPVLSTETPPPPTVIPVTGQLRTVSGEPRTGTVTLKLSLYPSLDDPNPIWIEEQAVTLDATGGYAIYFGATRETGLPAELFTNSAARWVGVAVAGEAELPRTLVLSAPYASKAVAAEQLGGKRVTDFVLSENLKSILKAWGVPLSDASGETSLLPTGGGETMSSSSSSSTPNVVVKYLDSLGTMGESAILETGGNVGLGTANPVTQLHIHDASADSASGSVYINKLFASNHPLLYGLQSVAGGDAGNNQGLLLDIAGVPLGTSLHLKNAGTSRFLVRNDGYVGVGTTSPDQLLHVAGNARIQSGDIYLGPGLGGSATDIRVSYGSNDALRFIVGAGGERVRIANDGKVGIGTAAPSEPLHVVGNIKATGNLKADGTIEAKYQDVAEWVDAVEPLPTATVVAAHPTRANHVRRSAKAYDTAVLGVVSTQPGLLLGEKGDGKVAVSQSGRVKVKVDARYGAIKPGDLLVSSPIAGVAMRSRPARNGMHRPGTIIGKALEALPRGRGEILVLLTLQ